MSKRTIISTADAPQAIGTYSQAIRVDNQVYISGQIPLDPKSMLQVEGGIKEQIHRVFQNLSAIAVASGGCLDDCVKVTIYLTDLGCFADVNKAMAEYFSQPYPARAAVEVAALPKGVNVEMDAIMLLPD